MEFEIGEDLDNLPNSKALKAYIRCYQVETETVDRNSNMLLLGKIGALFPELTKEQKDIYLGWGKGCMKRLKPITDPIEWSYALFICFKRNDNKVNSKKNNTICVMIFVSFVEFLYLLLIESHYNSS